MSALKSAQRARANAVDDARDAVGALQRRLADEAVADVMEHTTRHWQEKIDWLRTLNRELTLTSHCERVKTHTMARAVAAEPMPSELDALMVTPLLQPLLHAHGRTTAVRTARGAASHATTQSQCERGMKSKQQRKRSRIGGLRR